MDLADFSFFYFLWLLQALLVQPMRVRVIQYIAPVPPTATERVSEESMQLCSSQRERRGGGGGGGGGGDQQDG